MKDYFIFLNDSKKMIRLKYLTVILCMVFVLSSVPINSQNVTIGKSLNTSNSNYNVTFSRNINEFLKENPSVKLLKQFSQKAQNGSITTRFSPYLTYFLGYRVYGKETSSNEFELNL